MAPRFRPLRIAALVAGVALLGASACEPAPSEPPAPPSPPALARAWGKDLPGLVKQTLASGSTLFVSLDSPNQGEGMAVLALDAATGAARWGPIAVGGLNSGPALALDGGHVLALNDLGVLRALDPATGTQRWQRDLTSYNSSRYDPFGALVASGGKAYARGGTTIVVVDSATGAYRWNLYGADEPALAAGAVWTSNRCGGAARYDPTTGRNVWLREGECFGGGAGVPTRQYQGRVYVQRGDGVQDDILDAASGRVVGHFDSDQPPAFRDGLAYVVDDGRLQAVDAATGAVRWTARGDGLLDSEPVVLNDQVHAVSAAGAVFAFDAVTGGARRLDELGQRWVPSRHGDYRWPTRVAAFGDGLLASASSRLVRLRPVATTAARRPGPPVDVFATAGDGTAAVLWTAPADAGGSAPLTDYVVREVTTGRTVVAPATATTATMAGLPNGRTLRFTVAARNGLGAGATSSSNSVTTRAGAWLLQPLAIAPGAAGSYGEDRNGTGTSVGMTRFGFGANHEWNRATAWSPAGTADVGLGLGVRNSHAMAVNGAGNVVGPAWHGRGDPACPQEHCPFLVRDGRHTVLGGLSDVRDIDGTGRVVGWGQGVARWWQDGRYQSLAGTMANGTNGAGVVVGQDLDGWAVTWRGTTATRLPRPACSVTSTANAVNATGSAVGLYDDCSGYGAALWRNGQFVRLPSLRDGAEAFDINAAGDAVGISTCYTCEIATLWRQGVPVDLNSQVAPDLGWVLLRANAIADDGSITGTGWFRERAQAFVLRPPAAQQSL